MLHLFNKVYLDLDDKIDLNIDRVVISRTFGFNVATGIEQHTSGVLKLVSLNGESVNYKTLFEDIKAHTDESGKRFFIYCDTENFIRIASGWLKSVSNIDRASFETLINCYIHKECTQQGRNWVSDDQKYVASVTDHFNLFDTTSAFNPNISDVNLSFELYLATYLTDNSNATAVSKLQSQMSMFMRRMYQEIFVDIKSMLLLNILSPSLQTVLGGSGKDLTNFSELPKIAIFLDTAIWNDSKPLVVGSASSFNWEGMTSTKATSLGDTVSDIHTNFEGFVHNSVNLSHWPYLQYVVGKDLTSGELAEVINSIISTPSDYFFIPKTDVINVNYVLCTHLANLKTASNTAALTKFAIK
jgi:hypothetical protein